MENFILSYGIFAITILMFLNGFFSFPPSQAIISLAGAMVYYEYASYISVLFAVVISNIFGTIAWYIISWNKGYDVFQRLQEVKKKHPIIGQAIPSIELLDQIITVFNKKGAILVLIFRCLPFVRSIISIPAGISKVHPIKYITYTLAGNVVWTVLWLYIGTLVTRGILTDSEEVRIVTLVLVFILVSTIFMFGFLFKKWLKNNADVSHN